MPSLPAAWTAQPLQIHVRHRVHLRALPAMGFGKVREKNVNDGPFMASFGIGCRQPWQVAGEPPLSRELSSMGGGGEAGRGADAAGALAAGRADR